MTMVMVMTMMVMMPPPQLLGSFTPLIKRPRGAQLVLTFTAATDGWARGFVLCVFGARLARFSCEAPVSKCHRLSRSSSLYAAAVNPKAAAANARTRVLWLRSSRTSMVKTGISISHNFPVPRKIIFP